jgi:uncharacterized membrane protein YcaP (DUF421 family)
MDKSQIRLNDLHRILFGNAPAEFMIEVLFRTIVTYIFLLVIVKWLGKRMAGQVTITELGISIMLGAIVAPPMETPERGVLQGLFILFLVLLYHQWLALAGVTSRRVERITQGKLSIFVKEGIIQVEEIKRTGISRAQLMAELRRKNIYNLGKVKRMYMEACGIFSVFETEQARPGLSLLPVEDGPVHDMQNKPEEKLKACTSCGNTIPAPSDGGLSPDRLSAGEPCNICGNPHWDTAVI